MFIVFLCFPAKRAQFTSWNMFYFAANPENSTSKLAPNSFLPFAL